MNVHYILPIRRRGYATLQNMITQGLLEQDITASLQQDRLRGTLYTPTLSMPLEPISDCCIRAGNQQLLADIFRLPSAEYSALVRSAYSYQQPEHLTEILQQVSQHHADYLWTASPASDQDNRVPLLTLPNEVIFSASWNPERWALLERHSEWFLVLWFDLACTAGSLVGTAEVALDLGASPLVCVIASDGLVETVEKQVPVSLSQFARIFQQDPGLRERVEFELQRAELLRFTLFLVSHAALICAEDLTYRNMDRDFVRWARKSGLLDWHESWLHNRLATAGIPFEKVDSRGTSQRCSSCQYPYGQRDRGKFCCPRCGHSMDAHENAARNILARGIIKSQQWQDAHVRTRQRRQQVVV